MQTPLSPEELTAHLKAKKRVYYVRHAHPVLGVVHPTRTLNTLSYPHYSFYSNYFHAYAHFLKLQQKDTKAESCSAI